MSRSLSTIVCGDFYTLCINNECNVFSFGFSGNGAHGFKEVKVIPPTLIPSLRNIKSIACGDKHSVCLDYEGNVFTFGSNRYGQFGTGIQVLVMIF